VKFPTPSNREYFLWNRECATKEQGSKTRSTENAASHRNNTSTAAFNESGFVSDFMRGRPRANLEAARRYVGVVMQMATAAVFAATFTISASAQEFMAGSGTPAAAFPKPDRPVASSAQSGRAKRSATTPANRPSSCISFGIKSEMAVAHIGAGSGYYVVRLSPQKMSCPNTCGPCAACKAPYL